jgi:hypothetical protein
VLQREPVVCDDYLTEQRLSLPANVIAEGLRSGVAAPLMAGDEPRGVIVVHSRRVNAFNPQAVRWLALLADQTAVALDKVQLYARESRRAEQLRLVNEISRRLTRTLDPDEQIGAVVRRCQLFGYSDVGADARPAAWTGAAQRRRADGDARQGYRQACCTSWGTSRTDYPICDGAATRSITIASRAPRWAPSCACRCATKRTIGVLNIESPWRATRGRPGRRGDAGRSTVDGADQRALYRAARA